MRMGTWMVLDRWLRWRRLESLLVLLTRRKLKAFQFVLRSLLVCNSIRVHQVEWAPLRLLLHRWQFNLLLPLLFYRLRRRMYGVRNMVVVMLVYDPTSFHHPFFLIILIFLHHRLNFPLLLRPIGRLI